jgi:[ribosomal protein S5]-alanine N-acetyltransferase
MVELITDRVRLREVLAADADDFLRNRRHEHYRRHLPIEPPSAESIAASLGAWIRWQDQDPRAVFMLAAVDKQTHEMVGEAGLYIRDFGSRQGEIGWGVAWDRAGQGLATEIGRALLSLAFETLGLHRVFAQCRVENAASRRIMAKLGMREEGVWRENVWGEGTVQCSILSSEWGIERH